MKYLALLFGLGAVGTVVWTASASAAPPAGSGALPAGPPGPGTLPRPADPGAAPAANAATTAQIANLQAILDATQST